MRIICNVSGWNGRGGLLWWGRSGAGTPSPDSAPRTGSTHALMHSIMPYILRPLVILLSVLLLAACDNPGETARRVESLRGGCTEEGLREASEECIAMFDSLAAAGEDAFEVYLGALAAFDSSLRRRQRAAGDTALPDAPPHAGAGTLPRRPSGPRGYREERARRDRFEHGGSAYPDDPYGSPEEYGEEHEAYGEHDGYVEHAPPRTGPRRREGEWESHPPHPRRDREERYGARREPYGDEREGYGAPPAPPRRGVLLPPEERLRRPWIREEGSAPPRRHRPGERHRPEHDERRPVPRHPWDPPPPS